MILLSLQKSLCLSHKSLNNQLPGAPVSRTYTLTDLTCRQIRPQKVISHNLLKPQADKQLH